MLRPSKVQLTIERDRAIDRLYFVERLQKLVIRERDIQRAKNDALRAEMTDLKRQLREAERKARLIPSPGNNPPNIEVLRDGGTIAHIFIDGHILSHVASVERDETPGELPITTIKLHGSYVSRDASRQVWDRQIAKPIEPKPGEWIKWDGGDCPVPNGAKHQVRLRNGGVIDGETFPAQWYWKHDGKEYDIVAYRIVP
jgi:hypothetical protein